MDTSQISRGAARGNYSTQSVRSRAAFTDARDGERRGQTDAGGNLLLGRLAVAWSSRSETVRRTVIFWLAKANTGLDLCGRSALQGSRLFINGPDDLPKLQDHCIRAQ